MTRLAVRDLTVEYVTGGYRMRPLEDLSFTAEDGQLVVLLGPSGCGKTTLLSCLAGLLTPTAGSIVVDDTEVTELRGTARSDYRRNTVGVVFQAFNLIPSLSALGNVMVPLRLAGNSRSFARGKARGLLEQVDLADRADHRPAQLSGGQQQRVAIARALAQDPPLVIADEPTAHLDSVQVEGILRLIRDIAAAGRLVIVATHDARITQLADRVVELVKHRAEPPAEPVELHLDEGELLFRQGDRSDVVYVVRSGCVRIFRELADGTEERLTDIGVGAYFGELGPLLDLPRSASARAIEPTELVGLGPQAFRARFHRP
ncbi:MAG: ATP-binding cassette domain-containing protein [Jatrophihabitans sp.]|uniref:ATP-binding cassette domain-containing protein n=1 Tax=Jatrophihabitans sp. TaxID=1932789 RepID=UPI00390EE774